MTKRRIVLILLLCFLTGGLTWLTLFQARSFAGNSGRSENMSEAQSRRQSERRMRQRELEHQRRLKERRKEIAKRKPEIDRIRKQRSLDREQRRKEFQKEIERAGGIRFLDAKYALRVPQEQWNLIRPKLEKVINLWDQSRSTVGANVSGGSTEGRKQPGFPRLKWDRPWEDMPRNELTEAQRLARHLRILLEREDTTTQAFRRKIAALREAREKEAEIEKQLAEARSELREILTTREEAILVLLRWF